MEPDLEKLFHLTVDIVCILKPDSTIHQANAAFVKLLGWETQKILGRSFLNFVHAEWMEATQQVLQDTRSQAVNAIEILHCIADGNQRYLFWSFTPDLDTGWVIAIARESDVLKRFQDGLLEENFKLTNLANIDPLTELLNRRCFLSQFHQYLSFAYRTEHSLSLLMVDVDHFKTFNDTHGHLAGDEALKVIAGIIQQNLRRSDIAGRYGGEEFVICLPESKPSGAMFVAESLRRAVANHGSPIQGTTISIGVATIQLELYEQTISQTALNLISAADQALYASKRNGRNCSTHSENLPDRDETKLSI